MLSKLEINLITIIQSDLWMMEVLKTVRDLDLNDCWVGAGFVRNKIWDVKHQKTRTELNDIDVIYFNQAKSDKEHDINLELQLKKINLNLNWSVKNQARMHIRNNHKAYKNSNEAISFWPETATAIAVRLNSKSKIEYIAPYGLQDLFDLLITPTPGFDLAIFYDRIHQKKWKEKWNKLNIQTSSLDHN